MAELEGIVLELQKHLKARSLRRPCPCIAAVPLCCP